MVDANNYKVLSIFCLNFGQGRVSKQPLKARQLETTSYSISIVELQKLQFIWVFDLKFKHEGKERWMILQA